MRTLPTLCLVLLLVLMMSCRKTTKPNILSAPAVSLPDGNYPTDAEIVLSCHTSDAVIRYTVDGSEPGETSHVYSVPLPVSDVIAPMTNTGILKARAYKAGLFPSRVVMRNYSVTYAYKVDTPFIVSIQGSVNYGNLVEIYDFDLNAQIRYTLDGTVPTIHSTLYTQPFHLNLSGVVILQARAFHQGMNPSNIVSAEYYIWRPLPEAYIVWGGTFNNGTSDVTVGVMAVDRYEVTQLEYSLVMGSVLPPYSEGKGNYPVYYVSWFKAIEYCNRRSILQGSPPCYTYRHHGTDPDNWPVGWDTNDANQMNILCDWTAIGWRLPTEMEWMFIARGGNETHNYTYSGAEDVEVVAWYQANSNYTVHPVGTRQPNELGIFDLSGNLREWCWDIYGDYPAGNQSHPHGATSGTQRVVRGGAYYSDSLACSVTARDALSPTYSLAAGIGFRCVQPLNRKH